jgi:amino acid transporter
MGGTSPLERLQTVSKKIIQVLIGARKSLEDPSLFHRLSLIPLLAWIGLGADGLSSSSYGPAEAYITLGNHTYIALLIALLTSFTIFVISYTYTRIIEHFPSGGGGYIVATHNLGKGAGVVSGSALLIDYILTITVSIAACSEAIFSYFPLEYNNYKVILGLFLILVLILLNLRGVKESVTFLAPIFLLFIVTHILLLGWGIGSQIPGLPVVVNQIHTDFTGDLTVIGFLGMVAILLRAYSLGAGTYTGIEAVANGMQIMREPRVQTGKRTMAYMAVSLAVVSAGLFLCYLIWHVSPAPGRTLNAVLADQVFGSWAFGGGIAFIVILSEAILLIVASQAGFIDGPRVMANMAIDSWLPRRFSSLSERLTMYNGILLMGGSAMIMLVITRGSVASLVVLYAINVFLTFSLSQLGMIQFFRASAGEVKKRKRLISIHVLGFILCTTILVITVYEKFSLGGWITLVLTFSLVGLCYSIQGHYRHVFQSLQKMDELLMNIPATGMINTEPVNPKARTAVQLVSGFHGFGVQTFLSVIRTFPDTFQNFIFVSVAVVDSGTFKGSAELQALEETTIAGLKQYVDLARSLGFAADYREEVGVDVVDTAASLCTSIAKEFPHSTFFTGQVVFRYENPFHKLLHNETAFAIQRRLQFQGITTVILPIQAEK